MSHINRSELKILKHAKKEEYHAETAHSEMSHSAISTDVEQEIIQELVVN
jgi:hypothetical protein